MKRPVIRAGTVFTVPLPFGRVLEFHATDDFYLEHLLFPIILVCVALLLLVSAAGDVVRIIGRAGG